MSLATICSSLKHLVREVLHAKIGICAREIELVQASTGKPALEKKHNVAIDDRFKFKIPISDQYLTWEVIFNCSMPNCPPDFDLGDPDFFYSVTLDYLEEMVPSLNHWDYTKEKALINVISELRSAYLKYQVERLRSVDNRCAYEYTSLINDGRLSIDHVEVLIDCNTVHFFIKLDDYLNLTLTLPESDDYLVALAVKYGPHSSMASANLFTSSNVMRHIGTSLDLHRNINSEESLSEYVEDVVRATENQVLTFIQKQKEKRKQMIFELLKHLGEKVVQYDALEYNNASFLIEDGGFNCLLEVKLPPGFPSQPPQYRLLSVYSTSTNNKPLSQVLQVPYSENWEACTMVDQALGVILTTKIKAFQTVVVNLFTLKGMSK